MNITTIAVLGAGTMGRGIAYAAALAGYRTILEDIAPQAASCRTRAQAVFVHRAQFLIRNIA
jgi:3-hydroxybutyryl-CoA dehydrogenase